MNPDEEQVTEEMTEMTDPATDAATDTAPAEMPAADTEMTPADPAEMPALNRPAEFSELVKGIRTAVAAHAATESDIATAKESATHARTEVQAAQGHLSDMEGAVSTAESGESTARQTAYEAFNPAIRFMREWQSEFS